MRESYMLTGDDQPVDKIKINGKTIEFPCYTRCYCIYDNKVIVGIYQDFMKQKLLQENAGRNIWCYKDDDTLLWKIEESPNYLRWLEKQTEEEKRKRLEDGYKDYYEGVIYYKGVIKKTRKNKWVGWLGKWEDYEETGEWLWVRTATGVYDLDPETGKVSNFKYDCGR